MQKLSRIVFLLSALVLLSACGGSTSGSIVGARERCRINGGVGFCEGRFRTLNGTYHKDVEDDLIFGGDSVEVTVEASVEKGTLRISIESPGGDLTSIDITPETPGTLIGVAEGEFDGFEVVFQAIDGEATGVEYRIDYLAR
ncbi:MAG: hypothetical protein P1P76_00880 [Anaerolineales bacterium]|nr:hypothetical protein [Anaerolineales bacterium]